MLFERVNQKGEKRIVPNKKKELFKTIESEKNGTTAEEVVTRLPNAIWRNCSAFRARPCAPEFVP